MGDHPFERVTLPLRLVWRAFRYTCRFVDDLQSIANRFITSLLYNDMSIAGGLIRGIYCRDCPWEDTEISDGSKVPFMDILHIFFAQGAFMLATTQLYDKRRERIFQGVDFVQYSHATTCLSKECLYNILTGQLHRFSRLIMDQSNFTTEVSLLLVKLHRQGFKQQPLLARFKRFVKNRPYLFGGVGWPALYEGVVIKLQL